MCTNDKINILKERDVRTYAEMWHTSYVLLEKGLSERKSSTHQFRASLVFTAFTFEAYLNHIGQKIFKCWDSKERLSPKDKLNVISKKIDLEIDYGRRPWQVMKSLFGFRNDIAHGKSTKIKEKMKISPKELSEGKINQFTEIGWEKYCSKSNATRAREDVEKMVEELHNASGIKDEFPFIRGMQISTAENS